MRRWQTREELVYQTVMLRGDNKMSKRAIARSLGVSRNTIKKILLEHDSAREQPHSALQPPPKRAPREKKTDAYHETTQQLIVKFPDITAQRVFEELRKKGYQGGDTSVKALVRNLRPPPKPTPSLETPHWDPGEMSESDWSTYDLTYTDGQQQRLELFSYVLSYSTRKYYQAFENNGLHATMDGHREAFDRFQGCAARCKYDGQSVVARWEGNQPIYNPRFLAFCVHYEMRPWSIRGNPNLRPRVERGFWEHELSFLNGREFRDIHDFRRQLREWLDEVVDLRKRNRVTALDRFADEAPHLKPLPRHPYDTARVIYRVCGIDGFVDWQTNRYAVPYDHITDILPIRITDRELFVYAADLECIARHKLEQRGAGHQCDPEGHHRHHSRKSAIDLDQLRAVYEGMGEGAADFFRALSSGRPRQWSNPARRILTLRERYATEALDAALRHAADFGALGFESVQRILEARHRPRTLDEYVAAETAERLAAVLGTRRTEPRDLTEYDHLPACAGEQLSSECNHQETNHGTTKRQQTPEQ